MFTNLGTGSWISPFFDLLLFGALGLILAGIAFLSWRLGMTALPITTFSVFLFSFLTLYSWLLIELPDHINQYALLTLSAGLAAVFTRWSYQKRATIVSFCRRSLPGVVAVVVIAFLGIQGGFYLKERLSVAALPPAPVGSPSILIIVAHTLRADHLFTYGYPRSTSPNIDRLAEEGTLFEAAFSTAPWTLPSHASILTGLYPHEHGVQWNGDNQPNLDGSYLTVPESLSALGYRTAAFSANTWWFTRVQGLGQGFIHFEGFFHSPVDMALRTIHGRKIMDSAQVRLRYFGDPQRKWASNISASALRWLQQDQDKPFFVFINYLDAHHPFVPPQPYLSRFKDAENPARVSDYPIDDPRLTPERLLKNIDGYDGAIAYLDDQIGQLLSEVRQLGLDDNLLIVFTSDHGEAFGEHGGIIHANAPYREEIHVPLIFWQPGQVPAGVWVSQPVSNAYLPATIMDMLDAADPIIFPGPSLAQLWQRPESPDNWPLVLAEMEHWPWPARKIGRAPSHKGSSRALVGPQWHYIKHETLGTELYNWRQDPLESRNLADSEEGQAIIDWFRSSVVTVLQPQS
jgi:arylsulfatase A-like enzyme